MDKEIYYIGTDNKIVFRPYIYLDIIKACIVHFTKSSKKETEYLIQKSNLLKEPNFPPKEYNAVALLDNEIVYNTAMNIRYGEYYWTHPDYIFLDPDDYFIWEEKYLSDNGLPDYIEYKDI